MDKLLAKITDLLLQHKSVVLVGETDSGKTYWIQNVLISHLQSLSKKIEYLKDGSELPKESSDIVICDEVETLFDKDYLQDNSTEAYYTEEYLIKVRGWYKNYSQLPASTLFVITRNQPDQIKNLIDNMHRADWDNRDVTVIEYER